MVTDELTVPKYFEVEVDGVPMSGLISAVDTPRAVVVAWHGGATSPEYYDVPGHPDHSLMRLGASLGITVLAPDRPGYGASRTALGEDISPGRQVDLAFGVVERALRGRHQGAGTFLLGHSQGCVLAMRMASDARAADILGVELAGTGVEHNERVKNLRRPVRVEGAARTKLRNLLWEPEYLYRGRRRVLSPAPAFDGVDAGTWPVEFAVHASSMSMPVRLSLGDHEYWWQSPPAGLAAMGELFGRSRRVVLDEQFESGHNSSLGISARAYHLKVFAFVEECLLMHERIGIDLKEMEQHNA